MAEAALRELWASLLEIRTLRASDPGIRMAAQDLSEAAAALVIQSRPGTTVVDLRRWRLLKQAGLRLDSGFTMELKARCLNFAYAFR